MQATTLLVALALGQPLGVVINRYAAALSVKEPQRSMRLTSSLISVTLAVSVGFAVLLVFASERLAADLFNRPRLAPFLAAAGLAILFQALFQVLTSTLRGLHEFRAAARAQVFQALLGTPIALYLVWRWGLWGAVLGMIGFWGIGSAISTYALGGLARRRALRFTLTPRAEDLRFVAPFYFPYLLTTLAVVLSNWLLRAILAQGEGGYRQVGLFSATFQFGQVSQLIVMPLLLVATPVLTSAWSRGAKEEFRKLASDLFKISFLLLAPLTVIGVGWAPWLLALLGADYVPALPAMELLFPALAINAGEALLGPALLATGRVWHLVGLTVGRASLLLGLMWLLRHGGATGAGLAFLASELVMVGVLHLYFWRLRELEILRLVRRVAGFSLPGLALAGLSLSMSPGTRALTSVAAAATVVLGAMLALDRADRAGMASLARQLWSSVAPGAGRDSRSDRESP